MKGCYSKVIGSKVLGLVLAGLLAAGCGGSSSNRGASPPPNPDRGQLRLVNLLPDAPTLRGVIQVAPAGGLGFVPNLEFGAASALTPVVQGDLLLTIDYFDQLNERHILVPEETINLVPQDEFSFIYVGDMAAPERVLIQNQRFIPQAGDNPPAHLQFMHGASSNTNPMEFFFTDYDDVLEPSSTPDAVLNYQEYTPDFEEVQIRIRPMDFDQQSYSGRKNFYLPQFFKDNLPLVKYCLRHLDLTTSRQDQKEEQALIHRRAQVAHVRLGALLASMRADTISTPDKVRELREALADHYESSSFLKCDSMGDIVHQSLEQVHVGMRKKTKDSFVLPQLS